MSRLFRRGWQSMAALVAGAPDAPSGTTYLRSSAGGAQSDNGYFRFTRGGGFMLETI